MTYSTNIPEANHEPAQDQPLMKDNFNVIQSAFTVDHIGMVTVTNRGKHKRVHLPISPPVPTTAASEGVLYTATASGNTQLFYRRDGSATQFQITGKTSGASTNGYTFLFGGFYVEWGSDTTDGFGLNTVTFPEAFSTTSYAVVVTPIQNDSEGINRFTKVVTKSSTNFTVFTADRLGNAIATEFSWIAIGLV